LSAASRAVYATWTLLTLAAGILVEARLLTGDFRFAYVAEHSNQRHGRRCTSSPPGGGGQEGVAAAVELAARDPTRWWSRSPIGRRPFATSWPWVVGVLTTVQVFLSQPQQLCPRIPSRCWPTDGLIVDVKEGRANGLSPLLQYPAMGDPPRRCLYLGYVGFAVALCFRDRFADHAPAGRFVDSDHAPLDAGHLVFSNSAGVMLGGGRGPITFWDGAVTGAGIRWENASVLSLARGHGFFLCIR